MDPGETVAPALCPLGMISALNLLGYGYEHPGRAPPSKIFRTPWITLTILFHFFLDLMITYVV